MEFLKAELGLAILGGRHRAQGQKRHCCRKEDPQQWPASTAPQALMEPHHSPPLSGSPCAWPQGTGASSAPPPRVQPQSVTPSSPLMGRLWVQWEGRGLINLQVRLEGARGLCTGHNGYDYDWNEVILWVSFAWKPPRGGREESGLGHFLFPANCWLRPTKPSELVLTVYKLTSELRK